MRRPWPSLFTFVLLLSAAAAPQLGAQTAAQNDSAVRAATRANSLPLITTRSLKFTTDEASWISLDVSPDGKTIAFDILGDLYTLPIAGGKATRITSGAVGSAASILARRIADRIRERSKRREECLDRQRRWTKPHAVTKS
jgi:hypothetical protein